MKTMDNQILPLEEQLSIIKKAIVVLKEVDPKTVNYKSNKFSVCTCNIVRELINKSNVHGLDNYIPLFTRENAIKYCGAREKMFWWAEDPFDIDSRLEWLRWLRKQIKSQIKS